MKTRYLFTQLSLSALVVFVLLASSADAQTIFKPKGCSASIGPGDPTVVLQHPESRFVLLVAKWSEIEPSPGIFNFSALQTKINIVKSYNKKYALAIPSGGPGSPSWLIDSLNAPFINYTFREESLRLPLWWDTVVQNRIQIMVTALGNQFANDTSLALVYVTQMTTNGIEGHLNGIPMSTMYSAGFTPTKWINAAKQTTYYYANAFPNKAIAFEVHEVDGTAVIPETIINDLYNDPSLGGRVGAAIWWLSGKTTYQPDLLNVLQNFPGDKYAQMIGNSMQPWRFKDSSIATAFAQAKQLCIRYIEPWLYEYQYHTIDLLLRDFNTWADSNCVLTDVDEQDFSVVENYHLSQNYPNPFNPVTSIPYAIPENVRVSLEIYNVLGHKIATLVDEEQGAGSYRAVWDAADQPSGGYFYRLQAGSFTETKKLMLLR